MRHLLIALLITALLLPQATQAAGKSTPSIGSKKAPVTMTVWFDFQCPFCKQFHADTIEPLSDTYVAEGDVRIVFKDFQFLGADSVTAATYSRAVWATHPKQWYAWYTRMMERQDEENAGFGNLESIRTMTQELGLDTTKIEKNLKKNKSKYTKALKTERAKATKLDIQGTPTTEIDGTRYYGAQPYETIRGVIEQALN